MIEDRTRSAQSNTHWNSPEEILKIAASSYYRSRWEDQNNYIEVWCEKDAVSNIIQPVCSKWDVVFMANRGYSSQSAMHKAYKRLFGKITEKKKITVIYLGDHDPSGIDMTEDIKRRLGLFLSRREDILFEDVNRIALNMDQIEEYSPPENPAKITDSRYNAYAALYGASSWELDALEPRVLSEIVEDAIMGFVDLKEFEKVEKVETAHKKKLLDLASKL